MGTRKLIEDISYERNVIIDLYVCYYHFLLGQLAGWPSNYTLLRYIGQAEEEGKEILTADDLRELFPNDSAFRRFWASYEKPCTIESTGNDESDIEVKELLLQMQTQMRRMEMQLAQK